MGNAMRDALGKIGPPNSKDGYISFYKKIFFTTKNIFLNNA
jgi:hypothetical protein